MNVSMCVREKEREMYMLVFKWEKKKIKISYIAAWFIIISVVPIVYMYYSKYEFVT